MAGGVTDDLCTVHSTWSYEMGNTKGLRRRTSHTEIPHHQKVGTLTNLV